MLSLESHNTSKTIGGKPERVIFLLLQHPKLSFRRYTPSSIFIRNRTNVFQAILYSHVRPYSSLFWPIGSLTIHNYPCSYFKL